VRIGWHHGDHMRVQLASFKSTSYAEHLDLLVAGKQLLTLRRRLKVKVYKDKELSCSM
jgi:hypothetical protein